jgi:diacylglycerol kinase family enzyme
MGAANDFARTMKIPADLPGAVALIARGRTAEVDLGLANDHPFLNVASIGFSADLAASVTATAKKRWGKLGYAIVAGRLLAGLRLFTAFLEHDGTTEEFRTFQVSVGNGRFFGGGMAVQESASAMDSLLDFYSLEVDRWCACCDCCRPCGKALTALGMRLGRSPRPAWRYARAAPAPSIWTAS